MKDTPRGDSSSPDDGDSPNESPGSSSYFVRPAAPTAPPLLVYSEESDYRRHFEREYCAGATTTFDGIEVRFRKRDFDHCCFKSTKRDGVKDRFCHDRACRIDWIRYALQLPSAERYVGWDGKSYDFDRRVAIVENSFVTVILLLDDVRAKFWTSYYCKDRKTIQKIRSGPKWRA